jgi:hypothetical protein
MNNLIRKCLSLLLLVWFAEMMNAQTTNAEIIVHVWDVIERNRISEAIVNVHGHETKLSTSFDPVVFPDLNEENYTIEVIVNARGSHGPKYVPLFDASNENNIPENPLCDYGNPRIIGSQDFSAISYEGFILSQSKTILQFGFIPVAYVNAIVSNSYNEKPIKNANLWIRRVGTPPETITSKFPWADYGAEMQTNSDGQFGTNYRILPNTQYTCEFLFCPNHEPKDLNSLPITSPNPGEAINLGNIQLDPFIFISMNTKLFNNKFIVIAELYGKTQNVSLCFKKYNNMQWTTIETQQVMVPGPTTCNIDFLDNQGIICAEILNNE